MKHLTSVSKKLALVGVSLLAAPFAMAGGGGGPDYSALTEGIDFADAGTAVLAGAAVLVGFYVLIKGAKVILGFFRG